MKGTVALARALSKMGRASRSEACALIEAGRVTVNGTVVRTPLVRVRPERSVIAVDGERIARARVRLVLFHKPRGVVTTRHDPEGRKTVFDVLGSAADGLQAVGRLDQASTGLLLLTNDTRLAHALTDPAKEVTRRYVVTVRGRVAPETAQKLVDGFTVPAARRGPAGRPEFLSLQSLDLRKVSNRETHLIVELAEGKNRELRRLFGAVGHEVTRVHRITFGRYELGKLEPGAWREEPVPD